MTENQLHIHQDLSCPVSDGLIHVDLEFPLSTNMTMHAISDRMSMHSSNMGINPEQEVDEAEIELKRRARARERQKRHREKLTDEQKAAKRQKAAEYAKARRNGMSEFQRSALREKDKLRARTRRNNQTMEMVMAQKERDRERKRKRREYLAAHPEEMEAIKERDRERKKRERMHKKMQCVSARAGSSLPLGNINMSSALEDSRDQSASTKYAVSTLSTNRNTERLPSPDYIFTDSINNLSMPLGNDILKQQRETIQNPYFSYASGPYVISSGHPPMQSACSLSSSLPLLDGVMGDDLSHVFSNYLPSIDPRLISDHNQISDLNCQEHVSLNRSILIDGSSSHGFDHQDDRDYGTSQRPLSLMDSILSNMDYISMEEYSSYSKHSSNHHGELFTSVNLNGGEKSESNSCGQNRSSNKIDSILTAI